MDRPAEGFVRLPNWVIRDFMPCARNSELRVLMAVVEQTLGWNRSSARLSHSTIARLAGLKRDTVRAATRALACKGLLVVERRGERHINELRLGDFSQVRRVVRENHTPEYEDGAGKPHAYPIAKGSGFLEPHGSAEGWFPESTGGGAQRPHVDGVGEPPPKKQTEFGKTTSSVEVVGLTETSEPTTTIANADVEYVREVLRTNRYWQPDGLAGELPDAVIAAKVLRACGGRAAFEDFVIQRLQAMHRTGKIRSWGYYVAMAVNWAAARKSAASARGSSGKTYATRSAVVAGASNPEPLRNHGSMKEPAEARDRDGAVAISRAAVCGKCRGEGVVPLGPELSAFIAWCDCESASSIASKDPARVERFNADIRASVARLAARNAAGVRS